MPKKNNRGIPRIPIHGKEAHNAAFLVSIGGLIVNWANNESVFLAMLQALVNGGEQSASIIWHSHRTSNAKLDLVHRLCREQIKDSDLVAEIAKAISQFKGYSRVRNFFCHALYNYDPELNLHSATSTAYSTDDAPLRLEAKRMDLATLNEISDATMKLVTLNRHLWTLVDRLQKDLGLDRVKVPTLPTQEG